MTKRYYIVSLLALLLSGVLFADRIDAGCARAHANIARQRKAFTEVTRAFKDQAIEDHGKWHASLIRRAKNLLDKQKTEYRELKREDGLIELEIVPKRRGAPLNRYAYRRAREIDGVKLVYSPTRLISDDGKRIAGAKFASDINTAFSPHGQILRTREIHDSVEHEMLHAAFFMLRKQGVDSTFSGWLDPAKEDGELWKTDIYRRHVSFEELATHSLNAKILGNKIERASERELKAPASVSKLRRRAEKILFLAERTGTRARTRIRYIDAHPDWLLRFHAYAQTPTGRDTPIFYTDWKFDGATIKIPWVSRNDVDAVRDLIAHGPNSEEGRAARHHLACALREKLSQLSELTTDIEEKAKAIRDQADRVVDPRTKSWNADHVSALNEAAQLLWKSVEAHLPEELPYAAPQ